MSNMDGVLWHTPFMYYQYNTAVVAYLAVGERSAGESGDILGASALHGEPRRGRGRNGSHGSHRGNKGGRGGNEGGRSAEEHIGSDHVAKCCRS